MQIQLHPSLEGTTLIDARESEGDARKALEVFIQRASHGAITVRVFCKHPQQRGDGLPTVLLRVGIAIVMP